VIDFSWHIEDEPRDPEVAGSPRPLLSTWHFLRKALRREWRIWVGLSILGGLFGMAALMLLPPASASTATLLLGHPNGTDSETAMATDVSLLTTRAVATSVIDKLDLSIGPEAFQSSVTPEPVTSQVLRITVKGPDAAASLTRTTTLVNEYLAFRTAQMRSLTNGLISGYQTRIAALEDQVNTLTKQYNQFSEQGGAGQARAGEVLTHRTELNSQITTMQRAIEDATLQTEAAIASTHVIDVPRVVPHSAKRAMVLNVGSGVIAGGAIGVGLVLFRALTSERLRRRQEVALALGAPVSFSVRSTGPPVSRVASLRRGLWEHVPRRGLLGKDIGQPWRGRDLQAMVYGLETAISPRTGWRINSPTEVSRGAASARTPTAAAARSTRGGTSIAVEQPGAVKAGKSPSAGQGRRSRDRGRSRGGAQAGGGAPSHRGANAAGNPAVTVREQPPSTTPRREGRQPSPAASVDPPKTPERIALAAVANTEAAADILLALAAHLRRVGVSVFLVDLSESGALAKSVPSWSGRLPGPASAPPHARIPEVFRPTSLPGLSRGPLETATRPSVDLAVDHPQRPAWNAADVVLALVEVDPGLEVENLRTWVSQVVPLVTAGRSNAELLGTIAELIRSAGLDLPFAMMLAADKTDESLGLPDAADPGPAGASSKSGRR
jgi:capsular polysaccharide biosynthesis protein